MQTKLILEKDAKVTLVQIIRNKNAKTVLNDIGAKVADGAKLSVIHLFLSGDKVYNGCKAELIGKRVILQQTSPIQLPMTACSI